MKKSDFLIDFDDHRTSFIERVLVWLTITCMIVGTISEVLQGIEAGRTMGWW